VSVTIPSIGARSPELVPLGLQPAGSIEVPQDFDLAAWFRHGPTPGEPGPAVIVGHVDSAEDGPAVFFRLTELDPGAEVLVERADGRTAVFTVERVAQYRKDEFPTLEVYGNTDRAELRLITCGGTFDSSSGQYRGNVVAYARLVDVA
jgi:sortase (surface protein transpeptidase)